MSGKQALPSGGGRRLAELILATSSRAGLGPGSRLPTERQLAADLGVTRSGIRHALATLEADGLISREVGRGTFLSDAAAPLLAGLADAPLLAAAAPVSVGPVGMGPASAGPLGNGPDGQRQLLARARPPATDFAPADVMKIRRLLEPQAMPLVVMWATARDFGEMDRCVAGGDHAANFEEFETWDLALHRSIMTAAHSPLLSALYGVIESARHAQVWGDMKRRSSSSERRVLYQHDHRAIVAALRSRDADAAMEAMRAHLARVAEHLLGEARLSGRRRLGAVTGAEGECRAVGSRGRRGLRRSRRARSRPYERRGFGGAGLGRAGRVRRPVPVGPGGGSGAERGCLRRS
jgi:DNA-binding FadR family transcriptional regulator